MVRPHLYTTDWWQFNAKIPLKFPIFFSKRRVMMDLCSIPKESKVFEALQRNIFSFEIHLKHFSSEKKKWNAYSWVLTVQCSTWLRINQILTYLHILKWCESKTSNWFYFFILLIELNEKWNKWTEQAYPNGMANW